MSKKHQIREEALEKVNGGHILYDWRYQWLGPEHSGMRTVRDEPVKGWEREQIGGSIKLIDKQGKT